MGRGVDTQEQNSSSVLENKYLDIRNRKLQKLHPCNIVAGLLRSEIFSEHFGFAGCCDTVMSLYLLEVEFSSLHLFTQLQPQIEMDSSSMCVCVCLSFKDDLIFI